LSRSRSDAAVDLQVVHLGLDAVAFFVGGDVGLQVRLKLGDGDPGARTEVLDQVIQY
jgi:hypothetical protein